MDKSFLYRILIGGLIIPFFLISNTYSQVVISPTIASVCNGSNSLFYVSNLQNSSSTYIWQDSTNLGWSNLISNSNVSGVNNDTLNLFNLTSVFNTRKYRCIVDSAGLLIRKDTSNVVRLNVYSIISKPVISSNQTICYNSIPQSLNIIQQSTGGNGPNSIQWQNSTNGLNWNDIPSATNNLYTPNKLKIKTYYRVQSSNLCGIVFSDSIVISIYDSLKKPVISANQTICYGFKTDTIKLINPAFGANNNFNYQWQESINGSSWSNILNGNQSKLVLNNLTSSVFVRINAISNLSCGIIYSDSILITVLPKLVKPNISSSQTICYNSEADTIKITQTAIGGNNNFLYQWQVSNNGLNWIDINGANGINFKSNKLLNDVFYRVRATSTISCGIIYSDSVYINVLNLLSPGKISTNQNICKNSTPNPLTFSNLPAGGTGSYIYQWQVSSDSINFSNLVSENANTLVIGNLNETKYYRVIVSSTNNCGIDSTNKVKINVYGEFIGTQNLTNQNPICFNANTDSIGVIEQPTGGSLIYNYLWQRSTDSINWINITNNNKPKVKLSNLTSSTYLRLITSCIQNCGRDTSKFVKIIVYPKLLKPVVSSSQSICYNTKPDTLSISTFAQGGDGNFNYQWQSSLNGLTWTDIVGQTGTKLGLTNSTTTRFYRIKAVSSYGCSFIFSDSVRILVFTQLTSGSIQTNQNICYNSVPALLSFQNLPSGANNLYSYQWQISDDSVNFINIPSATNINYQSNSLISTKYFRVLVTSTLGCGALFSNIIKINVFKPIVAAQIQGTQLICYDQDANAITISTMATGGNNEFSKQWQYSYDDNTWFDIPNAVNSDYQQLRIRKNTYYRLKSINTFGCGIVYSNSVFLEVLPLPDTTNLIGFTSVCKNQQDVFYKIESPNNQYNYLWSVSGAKILTPTNENEVYLRFGNDSFIDTLRVTQINKVTGCTNVMKLPIVINNSLAPNKSEIRRKPNSNLLFCSDSTNNISYQWGYIIKSTNESIDINGANNQYVLLPHTFDTTLYYYYVKTKLNDCETKSYYNLILFSGIENNLNLFDITVFPNPNNGKLYFSSISNIEKINVMDELGRLIHFTFDPYSLTLELDAQLNNGTYFIMIQNKDSIHYIKFVLIR